MKLISFSIALFILCMIIPASVYSKGNGDDSESEIKEEQENLEFNRCEDDHLDQSLPLPVHQKSFFGTRWYEKIIRMKKEKFHNHDKVLSEDQFCKLFSSLDNLHFNTANPFKWAVNSQTENFKWQSYTRGDPRTDREKSLLADFLTMATHKCFYSDDFLPNESGDEKAPQKKYHEICPQLACNENKITQMRKLLSNEKETLLKLVKKNPSDQVLFTLCKVVSKIFQSEWDQYCSDGRWTENEMKDFLIAMLDPQKKVHKTKVYNVNKSKFLKGKGILPIRLVNHNDRIYMLNGKYDFKGNEKNIYLKPDGRAMVQLTETLLDDVGYRVSKVRKPTNLTLKKKNALLFHKKIYEKAGNKYFSEPYEIVSEKMGIISQTAYPEGTLSFHFLNNDLKEDEIRLGCSELLNGIRLMHQEGHIIGDLKPNNIMLSQPDPDQQNLRHMLIHDFEDAVKVNAKATIFTAGFNDAIGLYQKKAVPSTDYNAFFNIVGMMSCQNSIELDKQIFEIAKHVTLNSDSNDLNEKESMIEYNGLIQNMIRQIDVTCPGNEQFKALWLKHLNCQSEYVEALIAKRGIAKKEKMCSQIFANSENELNEMCRSLKRNLGSEEKQKE